MNKKKNFKNAKKMRKTGEMEFTKIYVKMVILRKFTFFYVNLPFFTELLVPVPALYMD